MPVKQPWREGAVKQSGTEAKAPEPAASIHWGVTVRYTLCLLTVAALAFATWRLTSAKLATHDLQDKTIATAGAQRMLSHQIAGLLTEQIVATDPQERARAERELQEANHRLEKAYRQLASGPAEETAGLRHIYFEGAASVSGAITRIENNIAAIQQAQLPKEQAMAFIAWMRGPLISLLDAAVAEHRVAAAQSLDALRDEQLSNFLFLLAVLTLEAAIVFAPLARRVRTQTSALLAHARQLEDMSARMRELATTDQLTRLGNRRAFDLEVASLDATEAANQNKMFDGAGGENRTIGSVGVVLFDLDRFKQVNDQYGHHAGDAVLRTIGERVRRLCEAEDFAARMGGDEFVILLNGISSASDVADFAGRLAESVAQPIAFNDMFLQVGASMGTCLVPDQAATVAEAIRRADDALMVAKRAGKLGCKALLLTGESNT